jgi:creatinine amidohydrolase
MHDHEMYFANLSWPQIGARLNDSRPTVLLFPVGATEPHGPHGPLCTDPLISLGMCRRAVRSLEGDPELSALILPPLEFGVTRYTGRFPGPIHVEEETLHAVIVDVCVSLMSKGFRYLMLVNNHFEPEHVRTLHRSLDTVEQRTGLTVGYLDLTRRERAAALTEEFRKSECHAGRYETSLVLADRPELVDSQVMRSLPEVPISLVETMAQGMKDFVEMGLTQAYNGAPALATVEEGHTTFDKLTEMLIDLMRALVRGTGGRDRPGLYNRM